MGGVSRNLAKLLIMKGVSVFHGCRSLVIG